jgi:polar amino acid transport system permease protein
MNDSLLAQTVQALRGLGLNYAFVLDAGERQAFVRGMFVTVQLALLTIAGSLAAGVALAAALYSGRAWLALRARAIV